MNWNGKGGEYRNHVNAFGSADVHQLPWQRHFDVAEGDRSGLPIVVVVAAAAADGCGGGFDVEAVRRRPKRFRPLPMGLQLFEITLFGRRATAQRCVAYLNTH